MHSGGKRAKFYGNVVGYDGTTNGKLEEDLFEKPSKSKSRTNVGNNLRDFDKIDEDTAVIDADYQNVYRTVPPRDPRNLGFGKAKREEPAAMRAISKNNCLLYTSPSPRDRTRSRMPSSA